MRIMVESLKRLYKAGKISEGYVKDNGKLTDEEKEYILKEKKTA